MAELTYERVLELFAETDKRFEQKIERISSETYKRQSDSDKRIEKVNKELSRKIADLGDTLGRFAEEQVRADLIKKFDNWGIPVHFIANHCVRHNQNNDFAYEVDILIYNSKYVVAIEVKNTLKTDHVDEHIERMKKMQELPLPDTKGKTLLAGVAGMIVGEGVDKYAENKGLFVLKPSGDTVKIVNNKKTFKPKEWEVK
ncbi:MAG: hypothetical protein NW207_02320 [Cytophagales bacterium]|nr:hypothetical protein [Cytophagales bacterium]